MEVYKIPRIICDPNGDVEAASHMAREGMRQLNILKSLMKFNDLQQDVRRVQYIDGTRIICHSYFNEDVIHIYVMKKEEERKEVKQYIYTTISDYVTIWDLLTGEVAGDVCDNNNNLITFPCHKDVLIEWLKRMEDRPTRQVLKDAPEHNRDYLTDNEIDIGNENRVELVYPTDPSYDCYYGVVTTASFTEVVRDESVNECDPNCCPTPGCTVSPMDCAISQVVEMNTPLETHIINCTPEKCEESFSCNCEKEFYYDCQMHAGSGAWQCRGCNRYLNHTNSMKYLQPYFSRTKHLYLCAYPGPKYLQEGEYIPYTTFECASYANPIDIESDCIIFNCYDTIAKPGAWPLKQSRKIGKSLSVRTILGNILLDYIPKRKQEEAYEELREAMRDGISGGACFSAGIREGASNTKDGWEARLPLWRDYIHPPAVVDGPEHATATENWCEREARTSEDQVCSESNRTGVSWCGSPYNFRSSDPQLLKWYRVLLRFYIGGFHVNRASALQNWIGNPSYCPNEAECEELVDQNPGATCTATSCSNVLVERFSSIQATIELENPREYPKDVNRIKYERPDDYDSNPDGKYLTLCGFPGREQGFSEEEEKCFPFDGTYVLHTLGKAIENLINNHYEDGSNDQLSVYLLTEKDQ